MLVYLLLLLHSASFSYHLIYFFASNRLQMSLFTVLLLPGRVRRWENWSHALALILVTNMPMDIKAGCHYSTAKTKVNLLKSSLSIYSQFSQANA